MAEPPEGARRVPLVFYRSYLTAADTGPIDALILGLRREGFNAYGLFLPSLKTPAAARFVAAHLAQHPPVAILNATAFSAALDDGATPLDGPGVKVFQVALSTARREDWAASERGLSPADLAMHVALPEIDGRIFAGVVSFKSANQRDADLQFARNLHGAEAERVEAVIAKITAWVRLAETPAAERHVALVLSTYPGRAEQMAHAVGLDALQSANEILNNLQEAGYGTAPVAELPRRLQRNRGTLAGGGLSASAQGTA